MKMVKVKSLAELKVGSIVCVVGFDAQNYESGSEGDEPLDPAGWHALFLRVTELREMDNEFHHPPGPLARVESILEDSLMVRTKTRERTDEEKQRKPDRFVLFPSDDPDMPLMFDSEGLWYPEYSWVYLMSGPEE